MRHLHCDVVVIGMGPTGRQEAARARDAGKQVMTLDAGDGQEVAGIYYGPQVIARTESGTLCVHPGEEIVVATGAAEIQPVAPGSELAGLVTARAASDLVAAGIELGRVVAIGGCPEGVAATEIFGDLLRFEGTNRVQAVVMLNNEGQEHTYECDTVSLGLGFHPRDALARMGQGLPVRVVGDAARESDIPPCPRTGVVCACSGVTVEDLDLVWNNGFHELELVKRATLAGTGTCQGSACLPHIRSFLADRGQELQPPFTARPLTRQLTLGEISAGAFHPPTGRTALHEEHLRLGARMERAGGWWRPWTYGDSVREYWAVREGVSICDVSTLGKFVVSGPDATRLLEHLYPTRVTSLKPGRSRYVLLLDERGYVVDDGLICRESETRFILTLTSASSTFGELWIRDWAEALGADIRLMNQTHTFGAINVTGPLAVQLLARAGVTELPGFGAHIATTVAGVQCRVFRLSFTGELSYELHHQAEHSVLLWRRLLEVGQGLGIKPHGLETLLDLRLEKGHIVVGKDTDFDSTPRRLGHEWAVKLDKHDFVGRQAVLRTNKEPLDRQLVGLEMEPPKPVEGAVVWNGDEYAGYVTSSAESHVLGKVVMLAWLSLTGGELPTEVTVDGRLARRVPTPFYDPLGARARAQVEMAASDIPVPDFPRRANEIVEGTCRFERPEMIRIVAAPEALDKAIARVHEKMPEIIMYWKHPPLRVATDEALFDETSLPREEVEAFSEELQELLRTLGDPHAIIVMETGLASLSLRSSDALTFLERACAWELPKENPAFAQGAVANIPAKLWLRKEVVSFFSCGSPCRGFRKAPGGLAVNEFVERQIGFEWPRPRASYDVVIVGGGGHGLAIAYYLATRHGITNVAVLERSYIGGGNSGRNTTVIRANYGIPEAVRFYQHSMDLFAGLEEETERAIMHKQRGLLWMAHSEAGVQAERARAEVNTAFGAKTEFVGPTEIQQICPQIDLSGGGDWPVLGASYHREGATARHDRVVWAYAEGAMRRGVHVHQRVAVTGLLKDGDRVIGVETPAGADRRRHRGFGGGWLRLQPGFDGGFAFADPISPFTGLCHQSLSAAIRTHRRLVGSPVLRFPDRTWRNVDGGRDRPTAELFLPRGAPLRAELRFPGDDASALLARLEGLASVDRHLRHESRLLANHGRYGYRRLLHHYWLGHLGLQSYSGRRRADGSVHRRGPATRADRAFFFEPLRPRSDSGGSRISGDPLRPKTRTETMSISINCPHCGRRPLEEFLHGEIPVVPESLIDADERDLDRAFMRANSEGPITERWFHAFGCRRWLTLTRDTRTDEIVRV